MNRNCAEGCMVLKHGVMRGFNPCDTCEVETTSQPKSMLEIKLDAKIKVKLTQEGIRVLRDHYYHAQLVFPNDKKFTPPEEDEDGYSTWELRDFINTFVAKFWSGTPVVEENVIYLVNQ